MAQVFRAFSRPVEIGWTVIFIILCGITLFSGFGLFVGLAFMLLYIAVGTFLISYYFLYLWIQADKAESESLLVDLQSAHQKLKSWRMLVNETGGHMKAS